MEWKWQNGVAISIVLAVSTALSYVGLEKFLAILEAIKHVPV